MKNIWETCKFSDEIETGNLDLHKFAVEMHDLTSGNADPVYQDPEKFLDNTFLTTQMRSILRDVLYRVTRSLGKPAIVVDTGFGGGKTHTLMLLYHVLSNPKIGFEYSKRYDLDRELEIDSLPDIRVVAIDGRDVKRNTLWGEIADKLGKYDLVKEYDESTKPISDLSIIKSFFDEPTLLMIDELPHYLTETLAEKVGDTNKSKLTESFIYKLISAVSSSKKSMFIMTLTDKQPLFKDTVDRIKAKITKTDKVVEGLKESLGRQTSIINPVLKDEIYDVLRHRLIKEIDENEKSLVIQEYLDYYSDQGLITDSDFQSTLERSYPFHPKIIEILYERVSTISKFNQTRGTLRFLALLLRDIYENKRDCFLLTTEHVNLENQSVLDEITSKIDRNEFAKIVNTDCIEHAKTLDQNRHIKLVESISRTIYLYSLHEIPNKKSGITSEQIKLAIGKPGFDSSLVDNALDEDIRRYFWYVKENGDQYYFVDVANENAIIAEYAKNITKSEVDNEIRNELVNSSKGMFKIIAWDETIPDDPNLKLYFFPYETNKDMKTRISDMLEHTNDNSPRRHQNTIVFLYTDENRVSEIRDCAKEVIAIKKAKKDEQIRADKTFLKNITTKEEEAKGNLSRACIVGYNQIGYPNSPEPRLSDMPHSDLHHKNIVDMVREFLKSKGKMVHEISQDAISVDSYKKVEDIYNSFLYDKRQRIVENMNSIKQTISDGVRNGAFGYASELVEYPNGGGGGMLAPYRQIPK